MIWTLFKTNLKNNRFIMILMTVVFCFYVSVIMTMYDPNSIETLNEMLKAMPETLIKALNFEAIGGTLLTFISGYLYGFLVFLFPMVLTIVVNHRLVASLVDKGSMAYLLSTPHSRKKIAFAQILFSLFSVLFIFGLTTIFTIVLCGLQFPGELEVGKYILLNVYAAALYMTISGICFLGSVIANESKTSLTIGVGLPILFLVLQMIGNAGDKLEWVGNLSLYALFDVNLVVNDVSGAFGWTGFLAVLGLVLYGVSVIVFQKKNMYL